MHLEMPGDAGLLPRTERRALNGPTPVSPAAAFPLSSHIRFSTSVRRRAGYGDSLWSAAADHSLPSGAAAAICQDHPTGCNAAATSVPRVVAGLSFARDRCQAADGAGRRGHVPAAAGTAATPPAPCGGVRSGWLRPVPFTTVVACAARSSIRTGQRGAGRPKTARLVPAKRRASHLRPPAAGGQGSRAVPASRILLPTPMRASVPPKP